MHGHFTVTSRCHLTHTPFTLGSKAQLTSTNIWLLSSVGKGAVRIHYQAKYWYLLDSGH